MRYYERLEQMKERKRQQARDYRQRNPQFTRAERRERTRQAVVELITLGKTRHSVKQMVQAAFEANGGTGDAGARVL